MVSPFLKLLYDEDYIFVDIDSTMVGESAA